MAAQTDRDVKLPANREERRRYEKRIKAKKGPQCPICKHRTYFYVDTKAENHIKCIYKSCDTGEVYDFKKETVRYTTKDETTHVIIGSEARDKVIEDIAEKVARTGMASFDEAKQQISRVSQVKVPTLADAVGEKERECLQQLTEHAKETAPQSAIQ